MQNDCQCESLKCKHGDAACPEKLYMTITVCGQTMNVCQECGENYFDAAETNGWDLTCVVLDPSPK